METALVPHEQDKQCIDVLCPGGSRMHYVTRRYHRIQKHKFGVKCPDALFVESEPVPAEQTKECVNVSRPVCTTMHYMTRRSHRMQKHKFGVT
jgi:hypothetical protein